MNIFIRIFLIVSLLFSFTDIFAKPLLLDKVAVIVDNKIILESDIIKMISFLKKQFNLQKSFSKKNDFSRKEIIEKLILDNILLQIGKDIEVSITEQDVDMEIKNIALRNKMSLKQFKNNFLFSKYINSNNYTYDEYRKKIKDELKINVIKNYELYRNIRVPKKQILNLQNVIKANNTRDLVKLQYLFLPIKQISCLMFQNKKCYVISKKLLKYISIQMREKNIDINHIYTQYNLKKNNVFLKNLNWRSVQYIKNYFENKVSILKKGSILGPICNNKGIFVLQIDDIKKIKKKVFKYEVHLQDIMIKNSPILNKKQAKEKVYSIYHAIVNKKLDFSLAAKEFSDDLITCNQGGDLGWLSSDQLNLEFLKNFLILKKNQVIKPIYVHNQWYLIKYLGMKKIDKTDELIKKQASDVLIKHNMNKILMNWLLKLKLYTYIKFF